MFNAELSLKRYWQGPKAFEVGQEGVGDGVGGGAGVGGGGGGRQYLTLQPSPRSTDVFNGKLSLKRHWRGPKYL